VCGGSIFKEIDLGQLAADIPVEEIQYNPESYSALILYHKEPKGTISLFSSGKFSLAGAKGIDEAHTVKENFVADLNSTLNEEVSDISFEIRYLVCKGDLGQDINLSEAMISLGLEDTEYEPEQFPALLYQPSGGKFATIFGTGKIILSGKDSLSQIGTFYNEIAEQLVRDDK